VPRLKVEWPVDGDDDEEEGGADRRMPRDRSMSLPYIARGLKISRSKSPTGAAAELESGSENSLREKYAEAQQAATGPGLHGRRESFLYRQVESQTSQHQARIPNNLKGHASLEDPDWTPEQEIVTPFAQVLASLREVRTSLQMMSLERGKLGSNTGEEGESNVHPVGALQELDWCLNQLESMDTHKNVADMAASKFKNMLNRELSVLSESKDGAMIADHIKDVYYDRIQEHEFDEEQSDIQSLQRKGAFEKNGHTSSLHPMAKVTAKKKLVSTVISESMASSPFGVYTDSPQKLEELMGGVSTVWGLDVFSANNVIRDSRVLTCTTFRILQERDLLRTFQIPGPTLLCFLMTLEDHYLKEVQYHNHLHAADVTQSCHVLLNSAALREVFTPLEVLAAILASSMHDVDHPGTTNQYLVATSSELALMYNDESVLENHHLAVAFKLLQLPDCDILAGLSAKQRTSFRKMVIDMVLATDMSKHMSLLADLKTMVETKKVAGSGVLLLDNYSDRIQVLQNLIHCCDLSNPTKPLPLYTEWVDRLMEESFNQGDKERQQGLEISPLCDRNTVNVAKCQVGFISYIVHPLWETMAELVFPDAHEIMSNLEENRVYYDRLQKEAVVEE